jgi:hypothetical protein
LVVLHIPFFEEGHSTAELKHYWLILDILMNPYIYYQSYIHMKIYDCGNSQKIWRRDSSVLGEEGVYRNFGSIDIQWNFGWYR